MPKHVLVAAALVVGVALPAAAPAAIVSTADAATGHEPVERAIVRRVNAVRRRVGLRRLRLSPRLGRAADVQSADIVRTGVVSHTSPD